jgi:hypothetical protein
MAVGAVPVAIYVWSVLSSFALGGYGIAFFGVALITQAILSQMERTAVAKRNIFGDLAGYGRTGFYSSNARLVYIALCAGFVTMPWQYAVVSMPIGSLVTLGLLAARQRAHDHFRPKASANAEAASDLRRAIAVLLPLLPGTAYGILQWQLPLILAAGSANVAAVGEFGALSRVGQIVGIAGVLNANLLTAHLVAYIHNPRAFMRRIGQVTGLYGFYVLGVVIGTIAFPDLWFVLIGRQYQHLAPLLLPVIISAGATLLAGVFYFATISLEQTGLQWLHFLGGAIAVLIITLTRGLPLKTSADIIWLSLALALAFASVQFTILVFALLRHHR